jgi:signal transduction histidine kinase
MKIILDRHFNRNTEEYRRGQFFLYNLALVTAICTIFAVLSLFSPVYQKVSYLPFVGLCFLTLLIFVWTGNIKTSVNAAVLGCFLVLVKPISSTGWVSSQFYAWLILPPLLATTLTTIRTGIFWSIVSILLQIAYYLVDDSPTSELFTQMDKFNIMLNRISLNIIILSIVISYERLKQKQQETIERQMAEMATQQEALSQKNVELERFAYVASHDLRTPLRNIISFSSLLNRRLKGQADENVQQFLGYINDYAHHMNNIIDHMLEYARVGKYDAASCEPVDMEAVRQYVVDSLKDRLTEKNAVVHLEGAPPSVMAEKSQIVQLLQNLLENALTYNDSEQPEITIGSAAPVDGQPCFFVKDNGIGIEPQYQEKVFDMFYRLHSFDQFPGTGLGLAICKKIVQQCQGRIWLESAQGQGTTIYFTLPPNTVDA